MEEALEKRLVTLTCPLNKTNGITFEDLFDPITIQRIQDEFAAATGVASIITNPDGTPITAPSNFTYLCSEIIRKTDQGCSNCFKSDAAIGRHHPGGPIVQPCLSGGLWDAGASITVGGHHIANWLIGQVRNETQDTNKMLAYARAIGADEAAFMKAFQDVPSMSRDRFEHIAQALFTLANQLSTAAYQNIQQARSITERKQAEKALRESEERFRMAMEATKDGLWDWDIATGKVYYSPSYWSMLGYDADMRLQSAAAWMEMIHPDDQQAVCTANKDCLENRCETFLIEYRMRTSEGNWKWVQGRGKAVARDNSGHALRMVGTHIDITERKQAEEEREKLKAQLQQSQKLESVARLAGGIAHDFNNMLTVIQGHADLAIMNMMPDDPNLHRFSAIQDTVHRSADLTRQLLAFARKQPIAPKVLDLNATIEKMLTMLRRLIGEDVNLTWSPGQGIWPVKVDPSQIDQILANLCINGRDAIAGVGNIIVETGNSILDEQYCASHEGFTPGEYVRISINDDGCGMDRQTTAKIFEPFFTTKGIGKGTGLGLATVYGAVKQNNGFINVYSEPGQGTVFTIYLPRHEGAGAPAWTGDLAGMAKSAAGGHETILLVEDETTILEMAKTILQQLGYTVLAASIPSEAIRLVKAHDRKIDLLLTDVIMPEMNGRDLADRLRINQPWVKRLFMSGYTADIIAHQGVLDEGVHYIQKPFSHTALAAKVRKVLDSHEDGKKS
jgi:PAS domain S-box-containing protein